MLQQHSSRCCRRRWTGCLWDFWDQPLLTSHCRWGGMFRIWIFLLLQRQSPGLGAAGTSQQREKPPWEPDSSCDSFPKHPTSPHRARAAQPQGEPFPLAVPWSPLGLRLSLECSLLMLAVRFPRKPPERSLCRAMATQGCTDSPAHAALGWEQDPSLARASPAKP